MRRRAFCEMPSEAEWQARSSPMSGSSMAWAPNRLRVTSSSRATASRASAAIDRRGRAFPTTKRAIESPGQFPGKSYHRRRFHTAWTQSRHGEADYSIFRADAGAGRQGRQRSCRPSPWLGPERRAASLAQNPLAHLIRPYLEAPQRVGAEGVGDGNVGGVAAASDQDAADAGHVVARVERVPASAEIGLEPAGEIHRAIGRRHADVAEIAGAIARRNVHAAAEGDSEVGVVAAHASALLVGLPRRLGGAGMLVAELNVVMDEIADRLDAPPTCGRVAEQAPGDLGQAVGLAVATAEEKDDRLVGQFLDRLLRRRGGHHVERAAVAHGAIAREADSARGRHEATAPVAEAIAVGRDRDGGAGGQE